MDITNNFSQLSSLTRNNLKFSNILNSKKKKEIRKNLLRVRKTFIGVHLFPFSFLSSVMIYLLMVASWRSDWRGTIVGCTAINRAAWRFDSSRTFRAIKYTQIGSWGKMQWASSRALVTIHEFPSFSLSLWAHPVALELPLRVRLFEWSV